MLEIIFNLNEALRNNRYKFLVVAKKILSGFKN